MNTKEVFVTGTDTGVGKTVVSALLLAGLKEAGYEAIYFKPIQTGVDESLSDTQEVKNLVGINTSILTIYEFGPPISPHRAAALQGEEILIEKVYENWVQQKSILSQEALNHSRLPRFVIEGAGGILCPITSNLGIRELIVKLNCPILVVASTRLGTINHTLLTLEAARHKNINIRGIILVGQTDRGLAESLENCGGAPVLAEVPFEKNVGRDWVRNTGPKVFSPEVLAQVFAEGGSYAAK